MQENIRDDRQKVYEVGYLIAGVPEEQVAAEADKVRTLITEAGATVIAEEAPHHEQLAYAISKKTVSGSYDKYEVASFGWIKFEVGSDKIEALKKAIEVVPSVLRLLLITTTSENTYLGKRAPVMAAAFVKQSSSNQGTVAEDSAAKKEVAPAAPATIEEMDKSIDNMVKEA